MSSRRDRKRASQAVKAQLAAQRRHRRAVWTLVTAAIVVLLAAGTTVAIIAANRHASGSSDYAQPTGTTRNAPGLVVGSGTTNVDVYFDFRCDDCRQFQTLAAGVLDGMTGSQQVRVVYHPLNVLDGRSGSHFSTRAAAAAGCAADAGKLPDFLSAVYGKQPTGSGGDLSNAQLAKLGTGTAGITDTGFTKCVTSQKYARWVDHVTAQATEKGYRTPPVVLVDGTKIDPTAAALTAAINAQ